MRLTSAALAATLALAAPAAGRPPLYRSPDGNTVTIELFNRGAATWAAGRSGSSGARTAYTTAVSLNDGFPMDLLVDTGAMGLCIIQQEIDWMLSGVNHFGKPSLFPSDFRGRAVIETAWRAEANPRQVEHPRGLCLWLRAAQRRSCVVRQEWIAARPGRSCSVQELVNRQREGDDHGSRPSDQRGGGPVNALNTPETTPT